MNTRTVNDDFDLGAFDDMFRRLSHKITAFWNAENAMRGRDQADAGVPIADAAVCVGSLASAQIAHGAAFAWLPAEAHHADEEEPDWPQASASNLHFF